nr:unnamed protein product [Spirometra erinaceieuropaei]
MHPRDSLTFSRKAAVVCRLECDSSEFGYVGENRKEVETKMHEFWLAARHSGFAVNSEVVLTNQKTEGHVKGRNRSIQPKTQMTDMRSATAFTSTTRTEQ